MTDMDSLLGDQAPTPAGGRRAQRNRRRGPGCLIALVVLVVLAGAGYWGVTTGIEKVKDQFSSAEDYPGPGGDDVSFEVQEGDSIAVMGRNLKDQDIVASVDAFIEAARQDSGSSSIQVGFYPLRTQMKASDVVDVLVDPANIDTTSVTIAEGQQLRQILPKLAEATGFPLEQFEAAAQDPAIGLPDYAGGSAEGYLFPATYGFGPDDQPVDMLRQMVDRWKQAATDNDLEAKAAELGYTPQELMTVASLVEAEGRGDYRAKIARVIYNRLEIEPNPAAGFLQIDASVNYALGKDGPARLTLDEIDSVADSPYNTYEQKGLPPGPIEAPGDAAIQAALNPEDGPWFFYVTVNLATGETKFTDDYDEFLQFKGELDEYCETESERC